MAPPSPSVLFTQSAEWMLVLQRNPFLEIADLAQPELKLAGIRINPKAYAQSRIPFIISIKLKNSKSGTEYAIAGMPVKPKISFVRFSPLEKKVSFIHQGETGNQLWVFDLSTRIAARWSKANINSTLGNPYSWIDDETILAKTVIKSSIAPVINFIPTALRFRKRKEWRRLLQHIRIY
jgi:hypothetical protein